MDAKKTEEHNHEYDEDLASVGQMFRDKRESTGIHLEAAAQEIFVDIANLDAMENDNFQKIGSHVFIRGYAKNYARYLGLNVDEIVAALEPHLNRMEQSGNRKVTFLDTDKKTRSELDYSKAHFNLKDRRKVILWPYFLITFIILAIAVFVGYRYLAEGQTSSFKGLEVQVLEIPKDNADQQEEAPEPQVDLSSEIESFQEVPLQPEIITEEPASAFDSFNSSEPLPPESTLEEPEELQPNQRRLSFSFQRSSWLRVTNSAGKEVTSRLFSEGETVYFIVEVPATIVMGNANQVEMQVNNELFNHKGFTKGNVARFTVQ